MADDFGGSPVAVGDDYLVGGPVRRINEDGSIVVALTGDGARSITFPSGSAVPASSAIGGQLQDVDFTYTNGVVTGITFATTGRSLGFTYNADGSVDTITDSDPAHVKTFSYNADGTVDQITVAL